MLLFITELNGIKIWDTDNNIVYLKALNSEYVCIFAGTDLGELKGHLLLIHKAFYGPRSSGAWWHDKLRHVLKKEVFVPCKANPNIWMHQNKDQYVYVAVYVDS